ncbi:Hypothetical protein A7982_03110 [Minicystis rosea]|nr:Hypothetical protein A7982_03110 [Minicystis rosea]
MAWPRAVDRARFAAPRPSKRCDAWAATSFDPARAGLVVGFERMTS